jgi:hypothetical protein
MSQDATISINKNEATITFTPDVVNAFTLQVTTNSSTEQHIMLTIDGVK